MSYEFVNYVLEGRVAIITMDRYAERRNSLSYGLRRDLEAALMRFAADDAVNVAVLTGTGNAFCVGNDLKESRALAQLSRDQPGSEEIARYAYSQPGLLLRDDAVAKPVIAAVNGYAAGGGFGLAMRCDLKVAAESATFWMPETAIGWGGLTALAVDPFLTHAVAMEISLSQTLTARRACELGLINRVVPDSELMPAAMELAHRVASLPPNSARNAVAKVRARKLLASEQMRASLGPEPERSRNNSEVAATLEAFSKGRRPAGPKS